MSKMRVMGLDLAAANSGLAVIEASYPQYSFSVIHEEALHHSMASFVNRADAANYILYLANEHKPHVIVLEDYARRFGRTNTSGYEHGEVGGMVRKALYEGGFPFYIIPPTSMRSYMEVPPRSHKDYLQERALLRLGYESTASTKKKRQDITDAVIHAHIGSLLHILRDADVEYDFTDAERRIIYGDSKLQGLKDRDGIYYEPTEEK
jgi:hypothetical protein